MKLKFEPKRNLTHKVVLIGKDHRLVKPGQQIECDDLDGYKLLATGEWKEVKTRASSILGTTKGPEVVIPTSDTKEI